MTNCTSYHKTESVWIGIWDSDSSRSFTLLSIHTHTCTHHICTHTHTHTHTHAHITCTHTHTHTHAHIYNVRKSTHAPPHTHSHMLTCHAHHSGVVTLIKDYTVCSAGDTLTPEQCRVLVRDSCMQLVVYVCIYILYPHMHLIVRSSVWKEGNGHQSCWEILT